MTTTPHCSYSKCQQSSRVLCHCCTTNYCLEHFKIHHEKFLSRLYQLTDDVNQLSDRFRNRCRDDLDRWRSESHQTIDSYYRKKVEELEKLSMSNEKLNLNRQVLERIQLKIAQLIGEENFSEQQIEALRAATNAVKRDLEQLTHEDFRLNLPPLVFDENFIQLEQKFVTFDLETTIENLYLTKDFSTEECIVMTKNSQYLLVAQPFSLVVYDQNLDLIKTISWNYGRILDICHSEDLSIFIVLTDSGIFTLDHRLVQIESLQILSSDNQSWNCCATDNQSLFLASNDSNVICQCNMTSKAFSLQPKTIAFSKDESIENLTCSKDRLALIILNEKTSERRLQIYSVVTLDQIWTISLTVKNKINLFSCCALNDRGWLIVDVAQSRLLVVTRQGQIQQTIIYQPAAQSILQLNPKTLAILTEEGINLHRIE